MGDLLAQPDAKDVELLDVLKALADPVRLQLLASLADGAFHRCSELLPDADMHKSTLSHHLKVLRQSGVTSTRVVGREHEIRIRAMELDERYPGLLASILGSATGAGRLTVRPQQAAS